MLDTLVIIEEIFSVNLCILSNDNSHVGIFLKKILLNGKCTKLLYKKNNDEIIYSFIEILRDTWVSMSPYFFTRVSVTDLF